MKRFADAGELIVPIPPIVVPVDVHLSLVAVAVEDRVALYDKPSIALPLE